MRGQFKSAVTKKVRASVTTLPVSQATVPDGDRTQMFTNWQDAATWYLANARRQGHSPASINVRGQRFRSFAQWANQQGLSPSEIENSHVKLFVDYCQKLKLSNFTINGKLRVLKTFYNELTSDGLYAFNPASPVRRLREPINTVIPLTSDEIKALLAVFRLTDWVELRDFCITTIILDCGLRATEALNIKEDDLHLNEGAIFILSSNAKGGKARTVFIGASTTRLIKEWLAKRGTQPSGCSQRYMSTRADRIML